MLKWIFVVFVLVVITVIGTIMIGKKGQENYDNAAKGNITRLSIIYLLLAIVLTAGVASYIHFYG